jgi:hydroxyacyl-ACP dehydratase HTD2-like protein with hotdog domain
MIRRLAHPVGSEVDLGTVEVDEAVARRYAESVGADSVATPGVDLPLGLAFALRGSPVPEVEFAPGTVSVHAGHTISLRRRFTAPARYRATSRIGAVFEKSGRSGPLTVVSRIAQLHDAGGAIVAIIEDQQIARWRPTSPPSAPVPASNTAMGSPNADGPPAAPHPELGELIAVEHRPAPDAAAVLRYADALGGREPLFVDRAFAGSMGYADVIVPGPLQSALLEHLMTTRLPAWRLERISLTFRVSLVAAEPIVLSAMVTELGVDAPGASLVLDLSVENHLGERAAIGTATLTRRDDHR